MKSLVVSILIIYLISTLFHIVWNHFVMSQFGMNPIGPLMAFCIILLLYSIPSMMRSNQ